MPKTVYLILIIVLAAVGLSACTPTCDAGSLLPPDLALPGLWEVINGNSVTLEWDYPDTCEPEEYEVILSQYRDFSVIEHTLMVDGDTTTLDVPPLDQAEEYWWRVRAKVGSTFGDYSHNLWSFFTLPYCSASDLIAPYPQFPLSHDMYDNNYDSFEWYWPLNDCIPESYRIEVSRDENFNDDEYNGATGNPSTRWGLGSAPPPATKMWWRVSAFSDGVWSPPGTVHFFYTAPACTGADMIAPWKASPADGSVVNSTDQTLQWSYQPDMTCIPDDYHVMVAEDPAFTILFDDHIGTAANWKIYGHQEPFENCQTYYWRVAMHHDGIDGVWSPTRSFRVDVDGTCSLTAMPGVAEVNFFCRKGTYASFEPLWTVEAGQRVLAVARNPQTTYVMLNILDQETLQPLSPEIRCWVYIGYLNPEAEEESEDVFLYFAGLPAINPPDPSEGDVCRADLGPEECKAAGGTYQLVSRVTGLYECVCP